MTKLTKLSRNDLHRHLSRHDEALELARRLIGVARGTPVSKSLKRVGDTVPKLVARLERDISKLTAAAERADRKSKATGRGKPSSKQTAALLPSPAAR